MPCVTAETLEACALIGLHMIAHEAASLSLNGFSRELGGMGRYGGPRNPFWEGDLVDWTESECISSHTTLKVSLLNSLGRIAQAKMVSLFLRDWELAQVALSCHMALDLLCEAMKEACQESPVYGSLSHLERSVTGVEPARVCRSVLLDILCFFWNEWFRFVPIVCFLFVAYMRSWKVGRALLSEVEARLRLE